MPKQPLKHVQIRNHLERLIRTGEYSVGDQLPAEHEIASRYDVSLMTARRAVSDLVMSDLLERRSRKGTFVREYGVKSQPPATLNIITVAYESSHVRALIGEGMLACQELGWQSNVLRLTQGQQDPAVRAIRTGEPAIVNLDDIKASSSLGLAMQSAKGKAIALHPNLSEYGVPTVMTSRLDDYTLALDRLALAGHAQIAFAHQVPSAKTANGDKIVWQRDTERVFDALGVGDNVIRVESYIFQSPSDKAYESALAYLKVRKTTTAIVSAGDEITVGILAACRELNLSVPADISIVTIGDSALMRFAHPPITSVDVDYRHRIKLSLEIIDHAMIQGQPKKLLYWTRSRLVERESVGPARGAKR